MVQVGEVLATLTITATGVLPGSAGVEIISVNTECAAGNMSRATLIGVLREFVDELQADEDSKIDPSLPT